jgi:pyruvate/2-oxoglutarate dehydrogenase complex dihydrolipoamide dehydrogenase (E3) component
MDATTRSDAEADVVVIGMGPGGEAVAGELAEAGLDVVGVEAGLVGGECPYWGCVPTKRMVRAAGAVAEARRVPELAGHAVVAPSWEPVARWIRDEATDGWDDRVAAERFEGKGGRLLRGRGRLDGPGRVVVESADGSVTTVRASRGVVVATGAVPSTPPIPGLADVGAWTNRDVCEATELPSSLVVLGGGAIGVELAQALARMGVAVTVVEAGPRLVGREEPEASEVVAAALAADGVDVRSGVAVARVGRAGDGDGASDVVVELADGTTARGERLLAAMGRRVDLAAVGLGSLGLDESAGAAPVDERLRVAEGVWAVGDVTGQGMFTHVAVHQAGIVAADVLGRPHHAFSARAVPRVTFTDPEVGAVGLTEAAARQAGLPVAVGVAQVAEGARGWIHGPGAEGVIKLVADAERGVLVGALAMGPSGGEVLSMLTLAVHAELPLGTLRSMVYAYPTFHRGVSDALADLVD